MSRTWKAPRLWPSAFLIASYFIAPECLAQSVPCEIKSSQDILSCVLRKHPEVLESEAALDRDSTLQDIARQMPNPEFETVITAGKDSGSPSLKTESGFFPILELGGKRKARMEQARLSQEQAELGMLVLRENLAVKTVLSLYRLAQIDGERAQASETVLTFGRILASFRLRPQLTPEQAATQASFELGRQEYQLKETTLLQESAGLQNFLEMGTGLSFDELKPYLPRTRPRLPEVPLATMGNSNSETETARNAVRSSVANLAAAKAKAWPDLKVGPVLETESLSPSTFSVTAGMGISLPLPLLNRAQGERDYANLDRRRAELKLAETRRKVDLERKVLRSTYQRARTALRQLDSFDQVRARHDKIENSFALGAVSGVLVIEAHRQIYEILLARHAQETEALRALWNLYLVEGNLLRESL